MLRAHDDGVIAGSTVRVLLTLMCAAQFLCWTVAPILTADAPPVDVVENTLWGTEHIFGSYKNPALSSWLLEAARLLTGAVGWPAYVLSQLAVCATYVCVYLIGRDKMGGARALAGTLLLTACYYFGWNTTSFNHDILEMPLWALVVLAVWRGINTGGTLWWVLAGVAGVFSLYGKLSAAALLVTAAAWLLIDNRARRTLVTPGPWIAAVIVALGSVPLALWLHGGALTLIQDYVLQRAQNRSFDGFTWLAAQCGFVIPMAIMMWLSGVTRSIGAAPDASQGSAAATASEPELRRYMIFMTVLPIALTLGATLAKGTGLQLMWGVPMLNLTGLILVSWFTRGISRSRLIKLTALSISAIGLVAADFSLSNLFVVHIYKVPRKLNWPQHDMSTRMREIWRQATPQPLKIIAGDASNWSAGLVALSSTEPIPSVFTAANPKFSPWITPERLSREGALVVWVEDGSGPPNELKSLIGARETRKEYFPIRPPSLGIGITLGYAIVLPGPSN